MAEQIVLLGEDLQPIGIAPKLDSHNANTPLHLAFSCYVFNDKNELLVTKRAAVKKVWPGVWTNSVCGHPASGESMRDAIERRSEFELGLRDLHKLTKILADYTYKTPPYNGVIENELCPVFIAFTDLQPDPNPDEVEDFRWLHISQLQREISSSPDKYSYWLKDQLPLLAKTKQMRHLFI